MLSKSRFVRLQIALPIFTLLLFVTSAHAATEKILHSFGNGSDGTYPNSGFVADSSGNLYGTTYQGGAYGFGTVFELSPRAGGGWTERILHSFGNGTDGANLYAGLTLEAGNLYGTTYAGGMYGGGTVFELTPRTGGGWAEKILHNFGKGTDGANPYASLIFNAAGNLYGTTYQGGAYNLGTVFEMSPKTGGGWTEKTLHSFGNASDGTNPYAGLIFDASGNLYGTTNQGGTYIYYGVAFELMPRAGGGWTEKILHNFGNTGDGSNPYAGLIFDSFGNLYGTTSSGGAGFLGTVFELTLNAAGDWTETLLFSFDFTDGSDPHAGLIFDTAGNLSGITDEGGASESGTAFELTLGTGGNWTEMILHSFDFNGRDGANPLGNLTFDKSGNLYSTTYDGGTYGLGAVFEITP